LDYCKNLNLSPAHFPHVNSNEMGQYYMNEENMITLDQFPSVSQDEIFDIVDQMASSSAVNKGEGPYID